MNTEQAAVALGCVYVLALLAACIFAPTNPTPGSDRERDCPGIPGARAGCPDRDCRGRHA